MIKINNREQAGLSGLPYLQRVLYYEGLRPYMDYQTGIVGLKRGISYQSLREVSHVEAHRGYVSGSGSKAQIRRALVALQKAGLILRISSPEKLIFQCLLADWDFSVQNKGVTKPSQKAVRGAPLKNAEFLEDFDNTSLKADTAKTAKAVTPPESGNIIKKYIDSDFVISEKICEKAKAHQLPDFDDEKTRLEFIAFHKSRGTQSCDWEEEFIRWLLIREKHYSKEKPDAKPKPPKTRPRFFSALDEVLEANREHFGNYHGRIIDGEIH